MARCPAVRRISSLSGGNSRTIQSIVFVLTFSVGSGVTRTKLRDASSSARSLLRRTSASNARRRHSGSTVQRAHDPTAVRPTCSASARPLPAAASTAVQWPGSGRCRAHGDADSEFRVVDDAPGSAAGELRRGCDPQSGTRARARARASPAAGVGRRLRHAGDERELVGLFLDEEQPPVVLAPRRL